MKGRNSSSCRSLSEKTLPILVKVLIILSVHLTSLIVMVQAQAQAHGHASKDIFPLTPLINSGQISEARDLASVKHARIKSYTGFLTVNESYNSNLFFWFIPTTAKKRGNRRHGNTAEKEQEVPLVLWLQGGPGTSSLFGLFVENGPFVINSELNLGLRKHAWTRTHSMLYIDSPVGTGFSFTDNDEFGYSKTEQDVADNLYAALIQFFQLFPEMSHLDFFIAGESYAGKYVPMISIKIHKENENAKSGLHFINLKGMGIGAGFCDPVNMINGYADYLYFTGLVNQKSREHFATQAKLTQQLILNGNYTGAYQIQDELFGGDFIPHPTYFKNKTGFDNYHNLLEPDFPEEPDFYDAFVQLKRVRSSIHVGNVPFERQSEAVAIRLKNEIFKSVRPVVEQLLELGYQVLLYVGQLDVVIPHVAVTNFISQLNWAGKVGYDNSERKILRNANDEILGYLQTYENLNYVLVRNAGHHVPFDQPKWSLDLITRFTRGHLQ